MKVNKSKILVFIFIIISSVLGIAFLSSCSNLFLWYMPDDSDIFLTIGKYWSTGEAIPYIDLFDHKGPMIFLIDALGYLIGNGNKYGVVIIETMFLMVSEYLVYKILSFKFNNKTSLVITFLTPVLFLYNFVPGNFTEEYMLPFLLFSFYLCLKWQYSNKIEHNPRYALVYGLSFGFALMTRVTNALSICIVVLLIVIKLVKEKKWNNLGKNALYFIIGSLIVVIPFCIYFASKNALYDMWYATLLYNFDYTSNSGLTFEYTIRDIILLVRMTFAGVLATFICLCNGIINKNRNSFFWFVVAFPSTMFMYMLDRFANYSLILFPFLFIAFIEIYDLLIDVRMRKICIVSIVLLLIASSFVKINKINRLNSKDNSCLNKEYRELLCEIPSEELNKNFLFLDPSVDFYLEENIKPCSKYFIFHNWQSSNSEILKEKEIEELANNSNIHYLLAYGSGKIFEETIEKHFVLIDSISKYNLYKRVEQ